MTDITAALILGMTLMQAPADGAEPRDPFTTCATRALAGEFGPLKPWQRAAYERGLVHAHKDRVWLTQYGPWDPGRYKGAPYHIAANVLPRESVVWLEKPGQLRVVTNCGAAYNDRVARADPSEWVRLPKGKKVKGKGCDYWADLWTRYKGEYGLDTTTCDAWVIRRGRHYR